MVTIGYSRIRLEICIIIQAESNDSRLISHPLVISLLTLKLREYASACYLFQLLLHLILVLCLTIFALTVVNPKDLICKHTTLQYVYIVCIYNIIGIQDGMTAHMQVVWASGSTSLHNFKLSQI